MDDGEAQDPFFAFRYINVDAKTFSKEKDKVKVDSSKPIKKM